MMIWKKKPPLLQGSLYLGLASVVGQFGAQLADTRALLLSYGSGSAATMFETQFRGAARGVSRVGGGSGGGLDALRSMLDIDALLKSRQEASPDEFTAALERRELAYGRAPLALPHSSLLRKGAYRLVSVDDMGRRVHVRTMATSALSTMMRLLK